LKLIQKHSLRTWKMIKTLASKIKNVRKKRHKFWEKQKEKEIKIWKFSETCRENLKKFRERE